MVVIAIMAIIMTMAIPAIHRVANPDSIRQIAEDMVAACSHARAHAILQNRTVEMVVKPESVSSPSFTRNFSDKLVIEALRHNFVDILSEPNVEDARVRFYPNGTSDEFVVVFRRLDTDEYCLINLEVVTGTADVSFDRNEWLKMVR